MRRLSFLEGRVELGIYLIMVSITLRNWVRSVIFIVRYLQREHFAKEIGKLEAESEVPSSSLLNRLDLLLENGLLRVGGRLENSQLLHESKHQIILPKCCVSKLIVTEQHQRLGHTGRQQVIAKLRETLWIVKVNSLARSVLSK